MEIEKSLEEFKRFTEQEKFKSNFIKMYLCLENIKDNFGAVQEYIDFKEIY